MRKTIKLGLRLIVFSTVAWMGRCVEAATAEIDGITWTYNISGQNPNSYATVTKVSGDVTGNVTIPSLLGGWPVQCVGEYAFDNCTNMTSITIPNTVSSFGREAFRGCTGLDAVYIDDVATWCRARFDYRWGTNSQNGTCTPLAYTQNLYVNGELLKDLVVPDSVTAIGGGFYCYTNLTSIVIPDSCRISSVASRAFSGCTSLKSVYIGDSVGIDNQYFGLNNGTFSGCTSLTHVRLGGNITSLSSEYGFSGTFAGCTSLGSIEIPEGVTSLGDVYPGGGGLFDGCTSLTNVTCRGTITAIGYQAFSGTGLKHYTIPPSVKKIGAYAFRGAKKLVSITIPRSVKHIQWQVFEGCKKLSAVYIDDLASWCAINFELSSDNNPAYSGNPLLYGPELYVAGVPIGGTLAIPDGVKNISPCAFYGWTNVTGVAMGNSVTNIGKWAFSGCNGLRNAVIGDGVRDIRHGAFEGCKGLSGVAIGGSVTNIETRAFISCTNLASVVLPDSVIAIGGDAFANCYNLKTAVLGNHVATMGNNVFRDCKSLMGIIIPDSVTSLGENAFQRCYGLDFAVTGNGVVSVPNYAFDSCTNLESVILGGNIKSVGNSAFNGCSRLPLVHIPDGVTSIGDSAFWGCKELTHFVFPGSLVTIGNSALRGCSGLTNLIVPDRVTSIGMYAFSGCTELKNIAIGGSMTAVGNGTFQGCKSLRNVVLPLSVTSIGTYAFEKCRALDEIFLPPNVASIGQYAFLDCTNLVKTVFTGNAPTMGGSVFRNVKAECTAYVPWLSTGWGVDIPGTWNGVNIAYLFTGSNDVEEEELPDALTVQSGSEVEVKVESADPVALKAKLLELLARARAMNRESGQDTGCLKVTGRCDEANGSIILKAEIDEEKIELGKTLAGVIAPDVIASFKADGTIRLTNVKDGFYYGVAAAERLEDLAGEVAAVMTNGLKRAEGGTVEVSARRTGGSSAFFKVVVSDTE